MPTHTFEGRLTWSPGASGPAAGTHQVAFAGRPAIEVAAAPPYGGDPAKLNPEELLVAALASCQLLTFLAFARRRALDLRAYEDQPVGTLAIEEKKMRMTEVRLRPRITIGPTADEATVRRLVATAHEGCFIANSVRCRVLVEPEIVRGA